MNTGLTTRQSVLVDISNRCDLTTTIEEGVKDMLPKLRKPMLFFLPGTTITIIEYVVEQIGKEHFEPVDKTIGEDIALMTQLFMGQFSQTVGSMKAFLRVLSYDSKIIDIIVQQFPDFLENISKRCTPTASTTLSIDKFVSQYTANKAIIRNMFTAKHLDTGEPVWMVIIHRSKYGQVIEDALTNDFDRWFFNFFAKQESSLQILHDICKNDLQLLTIWKNMSTKFPIIKRLFVCCSNIEIPSYIAVLKPIPQIVSRPVVENPTLSSSNTTRPFQNIGQNIVQTDSTPETFLREFVGSLPMLASLEKMELFMTICKTCQKYMFLQKFLEGLKKSLPKEQKQKLVSLDCLMGGNPLVDIGEMQRTTIYETEQVPLRIMLIFKYVLNNEKKYLKYLSNTLNRKDFAAHTWNSLRDLVTIMKKEQDDEKEKNMPVDFSMNSDIELATFIRESIDFGQDTEDEIDEIIRILREKGITDLKKFKAYVRKTVRNKSSEISALFSNQEGRIVNAVLGNQTE